MDNDDFDTYDSVCTEARHLASALGAYHSLLLRLRSSGCLVRDREHHEPGSLLCAYTTTDFSVSVHMAGEEYPTPWIKIRDLQDGGATHVAAGSPERDPDYHTFVNVRDHSDKDSLKGMADYLADPDGGEG